jgi:hypothetical protein
LTAPQANGRIIAMPLQRPPKAVETAANAVAPANCITERQTPFGYWWRYTHSKGEPEDT